MCGSRRHRSRAQADLARQEHEPPHLCIVEPELVTRPGEDLPHTFTKDGGLCLYYDESYAWATIVTVLI